MPVRDKVYDKLKSMGLTDSKEEFFNYYDNNENVRKQVYQDLKADGLTDSEEDFYEYMKPSIVNEASHGSNSPTTGGVGTQEEADSIFDANMERFQEGKPIERVSVGKNDDTQGLYQYKPEVQKHILENKPDMFKPKTVDIYGAHDKDKNEMDLMREGRLYGMKSMRAMSTIEEQLDERIKANEEALKEAYAKRNERKKSERRNFLERLKEVQSNYRMEVPGSINLSALQKDEEIANLIAERDYLEESKEVFDAAKNDAGFFQGMKDAVDASWITFGVSDLHNAERIANVQKKIESGQELSESEQSLITSLGLQQIVNEQYNELLGRWYKTGMTTADMVPFMAEMAVSPLSGLGKTAMKASIKKFGEKGAKAIASKILSRTIGDVAGAAGMAVTTGIPSVMANALERQQGYVTTDVTSGSVEGLGFEGGENASDAWRKAITSRTIENWSEMVGQYFSPVGNVLGKGIKKGFSKMGLGKINEFLDNINSSNLAKVLDDFTEQTQWNGSLGEFTEEQVGMIADALLVGDTKWSDITDLDQQLDVALGVGVFGTFMSLLRIGGYRTPKYRARKAVEKADENGLNLFGLDWKNVKELILASPDEELSANLAAHTEFSGEQMKAAFMYANALKAQQAVNTYKEKEKIDKPSDVGVETESAYDEGFETTESYLKHYAKRELDFAESELGVNSRNSDEQQFAQMVMAGADSPVESINALVEAGYSEEQIQKAKDYYTAYHRMNGITDALIEDIDSQIESVNNEVDANTNQDNGSVTRVVLRYGGVGHVVEGTVVRAEDGTVDVNNSDDVIYVRLENGEIKMMNPNKDLVGVAWMDSPERLKEYNNTILKQDLLDKAIGEIDWNPATPNPKVGDSFEMNGVPLVVEEINENGLVVVSAEEWQKAQGKKDYAFQTQLIVPVSAYKDWASAQLDAQEEAANAQQTDANNLQTELQTEANMPESPTSSVVMESLTTETQLEEPTPVGKGAFGDIYDQFKGKIREGVDFLIKKRSGVLQGVLNRKEVGDIDLVWGNTKAGLAHIITKHVINQDDFSSVENAVSVIEDVVTNGDISIQKDGRVAFIKDGYRVVIDRNEEGNWLVTALDTSRKQKEKKRSEQDATRLHQSIFGEENGELVSPQSASLSENKDKSNNVQSQENQGDFVSMGKEKAFEVLGNKYGEKMPRKVEVTAKALAEDLRKAQQKLDKAEEDYDNAPIGREDKAEKALNKARQDFEAVKREADFWAEMDADVKKAQEQRESIVNPQIEAETSNESMTADEFVAQQLANGNIVLSKEDYMRETGFGNREANDMNGGANKLLTSNGMTLSEAGDRLMEMDRENGTNFFDQTDSNAGRDALISVLGSVKSRKELNQYIAEKRKSQAKRDSEGARSELESMIMSAYHMTLEEYATLEETILQNNPYEGVDLAQIDAIFAEAELERQQLNKKQYESGTITEGNQGQSELLPEERIDNSTGNQPSQAVGETEGTGSNIEVENRASQESSSGSELTSQIEKARTEVNGNPTEAQKEAGNYKKGHVKIDGYDITIENPKGGVRSGTDKNGKKWSITMNNDYGYIRGTEAVDGDHIDVFLSDNPTEGNVFVIDQSNEDGSFDESKVMYGFNSLEEARAAYLSNYEKGWESRIMAITEVSKDEFKKWIDSSHRKTKAFSEYKSVKAESVDEFPLSESEYADKRSEEFMKENPDIDDIDAYNKALDEYPSYIERMIKSGYLEDLYAKSSIKDRITLGKIVQSAGFETSDISRKSLEKNESNNSSVGEKVIIRYFDGSLVEGVIEKADKGKITVRSVRSGRKYNVPEDRIVNKSTLDEDSTLYREGESVLQYAERVANEEARRRPLRQRAKEWSKALGVKVKIMESLKDVTNVSARRAIIMGETVTGWYEESTGEVCLYMPYLSSESEVDATYIHEVVAHKGLRGLLGDKFDEFCDQVWEMMSAADKAKFIKYPGVNGNTRAAADEYIAHLAETIDVSDSSWSKFTELIKKFLKAIGLEPKMTNADIANAIKRSYQRLSESGNAENVGGEGTRFRTLEEINQTFNEELQQQIDGTLPNGHIYQLGSPSAALLSTGIADVPIELNSAKLEDKSKNFGHDYDLSELKDLVKAIHNPMAIFAYGDKNKAQNIIVEIQHEGKNFIVGLSIRPSVGGRVLDINSIRNVFPKDNAEWLNWISQGKMLYADKERIQNLINQQRTNLADVDYLDLDSIANIINSFENPTLPEEKTMFRTVYHGSAASFDKFDHDFMSTGEGNQSYGWGTYVTEAEGVGVRYANAAQRNNINWNLMDAEDNVREDERYIRDTQKELDEVNSITKFENPSQKARVLYLREKLSNKLAEYKDQLAKDKAELEKWGKMANEKGGRHLYQVDIPDNNGSNYLSYKTDNSQEVIDKVNNAYRNLLLQRGVEEEDINPDFAPFGRGVSGETIYNTFSRELGGDKAASEFLNRNGFVGIVYPVNEKKGGNASNENNYVIFNEDDLNIVEHTRFRVTPEHKQHQIDIINETNPATDKQHTWIRSVDDIKSFEEALDDSDYADYKGEDFDPSYTWAMAEKALRDGKVIVYSSYPIKNGVFVTPSYMEAQSYGGTTPYMAKVNLEDVAWINPTQGQLATDNKVKSKKAASGIRFRIANQNQEIFVSNAQKAVEGIKQEKATPGQWLAMIEKNGGIKAGEDKWLGLSDWLKASDKKSLTKAEILDFIGENKIIIEEVRYGKAMFSPNSIVNLESDIKRGISRGNSIEDVLKSWDDEFNDNKFDSYKKGLFTVDENGNIKVEGGLSFPINNTRIHYTTEGLENKQEIALTVPTIESYNRNDEIHFGDAGEGRAIAWIRFGDTMVYETTQEIQEKYEFAKELCEKYNLDEDESLELTNSNVNLSEELIDALTDEEMRKLNNLTRKVIDKGTNSKRILVIDEIQSKRHQEGREKGYTENLSGYLKAIETARADSKKAEDEYNQYYDNLISSNSAEEYFGLNKEGVREKIDELAMNRDGALVRLHSLEREYKDKIEANKSKIPAAPFEKNWSELAMKRMLRYAAENGYDKVAWTTGTQQAERYGLSNKIDSIEASEWRDYHDALDDGVVNKEVLIKVPNFDEVWEYAVDKEGKILWDFNGQYTGENIANLLGKEIAVRLLSDGKVKLKGDGLRIGGEGMKGFYDKMLPSFVNKYVKKWGTKVQDIELPNVESAGRIMHSVDVTDAMKESVMEGQTMFRIKDNKKQQEIDSDYVNAVREGDFGKAIGLFREYVLSKAKDNGVIPVDYGVGYRSHSHSSIAKKVKEENPDAISEAAYQMSKRVPKGSILVPMPSRSGKATYTIKLAEAIAKATDSVVRDVLRGKERMSVYEAKKKGLKIDSRDLGFYITEKLPKDKNIIIVDNVIDRGITALAAVEAVEGGSVLAYAFTEGPKDRVVPLKLSDPITYDDELRIIPLSKRFNSATNDLRFRTAYHGSAAEFDKFSKDFIGSGEGQSVMGHGFYVTTSEGTSEYYANVASENRRKIVQEGGYTFNGEVVRDGGLVSAYELLKDNNFDADKAIERANHRIEIFKKRKGIFANTSTTEKAIEYLEAEKNNPGSIGYQEEIVEKPSRVKYEVEIPDDTGKNYLDLDKKATKKIKDESKKRMIEVLDNGEEASYWKKNRDIINYEWESVDKNDATNDTVRGTMEQFISQEEVANIFSEMGYVGSKAKASDGTTYIIYNEDDIEIKGSTRFRTVNEPAIAYATQSEAEDVVDVPTNEVKYTMNNIGTELYKVSGNYMRYLYMNGTLGRVLRGEFAEIDQIKAKSEYDHAKDILGDYLDELVRMKHQATEPAQDVINDVIRDIEYSLDYYRDLALGKDVWRTKQSPRFRIVEKHRDNVQEEVSRFTSKYKSASVRLLHQNTSDKEVQEWTGIKNATAKELMEFFDAQKMPASFVSSTGKIIIFADKVNSGKIEKTLFHENLHNQLNHGLHNGLLDKFYESAKSDEKFSKWKNISDKYQESERHEEFFAYVVSNKMEEGKLDDVLAHLSSEEQNELFNILNSIGYEYEQERNRRTSRAGRRSGRYSMRNSNAQPVDRRETEGAGSQEESRRGRSKEQAERIKNLFDQVADMGLDGVLGNEAYNSTMIKMYGELPEESRKEVMADAVSNYSGDYVPAMHDYLIKAKANIVDKIVGAIRSALRKVGFDVDINSSDVKYLLWRSKKPLNRNNIFDVAEDIDAKRRMGVKDGSTSSTRFRVADKSKLQLMVQDALDKYNDIERGYGSELEVAERLRESLEQYEGSENTSQLEEILDTYESDFEDSYSRWGRRMEDGSEEFIEALEAYVSNDSDTLFRSVDEVEGMADDTARWLYEKSVKGNAYRFQEGFQDAMLSLKKLQEAIVKQVGGKLEEWEDAYTAENQMSSRDTSEIENFMFNHFKPMMDAVAKFLRRTGLTYEDLRTYLFAKSGLERNRDFAVRDAIAQREKDGDDVSGIYEAYLQRKQELLQDLKDGTITFREYCEEMDNEAMMIAPDLMGRDYSGLSSLFGEDTFTEDAISEVEQVENLANTDALWNAIKGATQFSLDRAKQSGVMSTDVHKKLSEMFEWYIPMRGWSETKARDVYDYFGRQEGVFNPTIKNAYGRKSLADDPLATIANMAESAIFQGNKNQMKQKLLNLAFDKPTNLITVMDSWIENKGTEDDPRWEYVYPPIEQDDDADVIAAKIKQFEEEMEQKKDAGVAKKLRGKADIPYIATPKEIAEHIIRVKRNGREFVMIINGNPRAAQAINGETNPETYNGIIEQVSRRLNRFMAAAFTTKNPTFIMRNLSRDLIFSNTAVAIKESNAYGKKFRGNQMKVLGNMRGLMKRYQSGKLDMNNPLDKMFQEFIQNGGETGFAQLTSVDEYKKKIQRELKDAKNRGKKISGKKVGRAVMDTIEFYNRCAEDVSRFTVYMTSRQMGRSIQRSVSDAKEITVNFNKRGSGSKAGGFIGFGAQSMRSLYLFFNAAVQALVNFKRLGQKHPIAFTTALSMYTVSGFLMPVVNEFLSSILGGDDDDYENLPEWVRRNNLVISLGKWGGDAMFLTVPLPIEMRAFYGLGETSNQLLAGNVRGKNAAIQIAGQFAEMLPLNFVTDAAGPFNAFTPDAFKPIAQAYVANKDWTGKPIYRDNGFNKELPEWTKAYAGTSKWLVNSAELLNELTGGDKYKSGVVDINPARLEHLFTGYLGGFGDMFLGGYKTISMLWDEDYRNVRNTPVLKAFLNQSDERTSYYQVKKDYASFKDEYEDTVRRLNGYKRELKQPETALEYAERMDFLQRSPQIKRYEVMKIYEKELNKLYQQMREIPDPEVQKAITTTINQIKSDAVTNLREIK